jgi:hypothetical protein
MFAAKARPLTRFLREDVHAIMEDEVSRRAFEQLKSALQVVPILRTPNWNKPFLVYCDAFGEAVGSTLSQLDKNGHDHPIHLASRQLTSAEKNYTVTEQESLAIIFSLKKFRHYLLGYKAKIVTDHKALTYLVNKPNPSGRLARWRNLTLTLSIVQGGGMVMLMALQGHTKEWVMFQRMMTF